MHLLLCTPGNLLSFCLLELPTAGLDCCFVGKEWTVMGWCCQIRTRSACNHQSVQMRDGSDVEGEELRRDTRDRSSCCMFIDMPCFLHAQRILLSARVCVCAPQKHPWGLKPCCLGKMSELLPRSGGFLA